jgi:2-keto-4-pentenoate hydratase/2-oxohepta-3-ene-1,7-dioic acid hydratase in catechol pathway
MRLITFSDEDAPRIGLLDGDEIVDLRVADPALPTEMCAFLAAGPEALASAREALEGGAARRPLSAVKLLSPVLRPPKFLAVGLNYRDHAEETGLEIPKVPMIFNKQSTCAHPPGEPFHLPRASHRLDYEGELAFVIGRTCRHVPREHAADVIAGYTICNDVSVRDWQMRVPTFTMGKSFDTHGPLGPAIVTPDEAGDPHDKDIRTWVNGATRQSSSTRHLIFDCFDLVEHLSTAFTLEPGDVITTGTPSGIGAATRPPTWLVAGDVVRIAIEGLSELENAVVPEPQTTVRY